MANTSEQPESSSLQSRLEASCASFTGKLPQGAHIRIEDDGQDLEVYAWAPNDDRLLLCAIAYDSDFNIARGMIATRAEMLIQGYLSLHPMRAPYAFGHEKE